MSSNIINFEEHSIIECNDCKKVVKRFFAGAYPNQKDKRWVDAEGRQFNGKKCPQCQADRAAQRKRIVRGSKRRIIKEA